MTVVLIIAHTKKLGQSLISVLIFEMGMNDFCNQISLKTLN
jgi:hypothetical protein